MPLPISPSSCGDGDLSEALGACAPTENPGQNTLMFTGYAEFDPEAEDGPSWTFGWGLTAEAQLLGATMLGEVQYLAAPIATNAELASVAAAFIANGELEESDLSLPVGEDFGPPALIARFTIAVGTCVGYAYFGLNAPASAFGDPGPSYAFAVTLPGGQISTVIGGGISDPWSELQTADNPYQMATEFICTSSPYLKVGPSDCGDPIPVSLPADLLGECLAIPPEGEASWQLDFASEEGEFTVATSGDLFDLAPITLQTMVPATLDTAGVLAVLSNPDAYEWEATEIPPSIPWGSFPEGVTAVVRIIASDEGGCEATVGVAFAGPVAEEGMHVGIYRQQNDGGSWDSTGQQIQDLTTNTSASGNAPWICTPQEFVRVAPARCAVFPTEVASQPVLLDLYTVRGSNNSWCNNPAVMARVKRTDESADPTAKVIIHTAINGNTLELEQGETFEVVVPAGYHLAENAIQVELQGPNNDLENVETMAIAQVVGLMPAALAPPGWP